MEMLDGHRPKNLKLRQAGSGLHRLWDVEVVIRNDHMYLCHGWEQSIRDYDLRHGYFLVFRYDGDAMLPVKVSNTTMCRMRYQDDDDASTLCLFFFYIWLCLTSIVNGHCYIWTGNGSSNSDTGYSQSSSNYGCSKSNNDSGLSKSSSEDNKKDDPD